MRSRGLETETEARSRRQGTGEFAATGDRRSLDSLSFTYFDWISTHRKDPAAALAEVNGYHRPNVLRRINDWFYVNKR
jgi:hypothetical protein